MFPAECFPLDFILPLEWWITYDAEFTAERHASPLTKSYTVGFFLAKKPKDNSYNPGATTKIVVLSWSHKKFSGQVLAA